MTTVYMVILDADFELCWDGDKPGVYANPESAEKLAQYLREQFPETTFRTTKVEVLP